MQLLFLILISFAIVSNARWYNPFANPKAIVTLSNARFTILTSDLIRVEYSLNKEFEDHSTIAILNRNLPVPTYNVSSQGSCLEITTETLKLSYCPENDGPDGFTATSLKISRSFDTPFEWVPGLVDDGNLHGTLRTLEGVDSAGPHEMNCSRVPPDSPTFATHCTEGVVSRNGWAVVDDSKRPLLDGSAWDWVLPRNTSTSIIDWYFFGHGHNYKQALVDLTLISGKIPLPPRYSFGVFFSRYWAYSDRGEKEIVSEYVAHGTPLDVLVVDMDWHITFYKEARAGKVDQAGQRIGWTGYTWDSNLFPDPKGFLDWTAQQGLHLTLNLHPASGVQPHELRYPQMATAMGQNPADKKYVPFVPESKKYVTNWFDIILDPITADGVSFWWLDWQQWQNTSISGLNPTFWLNHMFFTHMEQQGQDRPLILHRWGGLGNHRYQLGFSGDVTPTWAALNFQPYFTATAANVGFMWSHDIGGHTLPSPPELYTRWVQFGVWSPVFRTHCTKSPENDRRIWTYPIQNYEIMRDYILLRSRLVPYIYTAARDTHDTSLSFVHSLYYEWPELSESYSESNQYMFGSDIMVVPITEPMDPITQLIQRKLWVPPGQWIEWGSGQVFTGPLYVTRSYTLKEMPVFVKAGSIIPMLPASKPLLGSAQMQYTSLSFQIFLGGPGTTTTGRVYEDSGNDNADYDSEYAWTTLQQTEDKSAIKLTVNPAIGSYPTMPTSRLLSFKFIGTLPPSQVLIGGDVILPKVPGTPQTGWYYGGNDLSVNIDLATSVPVASQLDVVIVKNPLLNPLTTQIAGLPRCFDRLLTCVNLVDNHFPDVFQEDYTALLDASGVASIVGENPAVISQFSNLLAQAITQVSNLHNLDSNTSMQVLATLQDCNQ